MVMERSHCKRNEWMDPKPGCSGTNSRTGGDDALTSPTALVFSHCALMVDMRGNTPYVAEFLLAEVLHKAHV